jgi:uncharacterized membrane protein
MVSTPTARPTLMQGQDISQMREVLRRNPRSPLSVNVGQTERLISMLTGGLLFLYALGRRSWNGFGLALIGGELLRRGMTGHSYLYQMLDISTYYAPATISMLPMRQGIKVRRSMTIERSPEELYRFWRNVEHAPSYMQCIRLVKVIDKTKSHWVGVTAGGATIEWDSEITEDIPNRLIAWRTIGRAPIGVGGRITFTPAPADKGTVATVEMEFSSKGSILGEPVEMLIAHLPEREVRETLRRFKELMEAGEIPAIAGQPVGARQLMSEQGRKM